MVSGEQWTRLPSSSVGNGPAARKSRKRSEGLTRKESQRCRYGQHRAPKYLDQQPCARRRDIRDGRDGRGQPGSIWKDFQLPPASPGASPQARGHVGERRLGGLESRGAAVEPPGLEASNPDFARLAFPHQLPTTGTPAALSTPQPPPPPPPPPPTAASLSLNTKLVQP